MSTESDRLLVQQIRANDAAAWSELDKRYRGRLTYHSAHSFTKDGPETDGEIPIELGEIAIVPKPR